MRLDPRLLAGLPQSLWIGLNVLFFRTAALRARAITVDQVAALVLVNVLVCGGLRFVDYTAGAHFFGAGLVAVSTPILFFFLTAHIAARHRGGPDTALGLLAGFYGALPAVLIAVFVSLRMYERYDRGPHTFEIVVGVWLLAMVMRLIHAVGPRPGVRRMVACAALFAMTWLLPMFAVGRTMVFYPTFEKELADDEADARRHDELVFAEAEKVLRAETRIANERPGVSDLYFVGAAGWANQDVFGREVESARRLFDERFDTAGRSIVLANEPSPRDAVPLTATPTLRHVLKTVGERMNHEEDILFLFMTSHGSNQGLALLPPRRGAFQDETLTPANLRSMLDSSGIKWRVLVIAGCESGVFIDPLQNEFTLIATAAASDRESYGCAMGNAFTDFGRAVFGEQLIHETSFLTAFTNAANAIGQRESDGGLRASRPQIAEGAAIREKLRALEERLATKAALDVGVERATYSQPEYRNAQSRGKE